MNTLLITLTNASGVPFYRQIIDQITRMIQSGTLQPGTQLPSVRELAANLLVSLITVRRAYADLEVAGLIIRRQGFGTYVRENVKTALQNHVNQEIKHILETAIIKVKQLGASDADIKHILEEQFGKEDKS